MKADILKLLLQSHVEGDESSFRKAALQLAAAESTAGQDVGEMNRVVTAFLQLVDADISGSILVLLAEKRQALITQAVTKRLDPNVPMKDSGVEWIDAVPEHWRVVPTKLLGWFRGGAGFPDDEQGQQSLPSLNGSVFGRQPMPVPPLEEQERIVAHVRSELRRLDGLAQRAQAIVDKLREYRQALITAAVTGKLDVSKEAA